jgi:uncharacterized protein with ATP-grasp and redox domains
MSTKKEETRLQAMTELLQMMGEQFNNKSVPSVIGADRGRIIARVTGCEDPYNELKKKANKRAMELLSRMSAIIDSVPDEDRLKTACLISCIGNVIDYDIPGSNSNLDNAIDYLEDGFFIDHITELKELLGEDVDILYLTDNAGEIVFDTLVVKELKRLGCRVTVSVKGGPSLNDALMEDAEMVGMTVVANEVITTGTDAIGIRLDESPEYFKQRFYSTDIIIAKGMANWETLTEIPAPCPLLFLFRTKCEPVANSLGVPLHQNVAFLVRGGWKL